MSSAHVGNWYWTWISLFSAEEPCTRGVPESGSEVRKCWIWASDVCVSSQQPFYIIWYSVLVPSHDHAVGGSSVQSNCGLRTALRQNVVSNLAGARRRNCQRPEFKDSAHSHARDSQSKEHRANCTVFWFYSDIFNGQHTPSQSNGRSTQKFDNVATQQNVFRGLTTVQCTPIINSCWSVFIVGQGDNSGRG